MKQTKIEAMLFALLKASLQELPANESFFIDASEDDWVKCYQLATQQGVMAVAWDGIQSLPTQLQPPIDLKIVWGLTVEQYEKKYERYCRTASELADYYAKHHIAMVQLKGVGLSSCYPIPSHREGGDIDIYTYSGDKEKMTDSEANSLADNLMKRQGIEVNMHSPKHSNFYYKGIPIENHKTFLNVETYPIAKQMNKVLHNYLQPQLTTLVDGKYFIQTPSPAFNALFLSFHAAQHYGSGLALHHLYDWACLLKRYGWCLPEEVTDKRLLRFIQALTGLAHCLLGTSIYKDADTDMMNKIYQEIFHPRYSTKTIPVKGYWNILVYKYKRFMYKFHLKQEVIEGSLIKRLWESIVAHLRYPSSIFRTEAL